MTDNVSADEAFVGTVEPEGADRLDEAKLAEWMQVNVEGFKGPLHLSKFKGGQSNPTYRDLFPEPPPAGLVPSCAEAGIVGALTGVMGTLQAMEVIKLITGVGEPLVGRLLLYDALAARFDTMKYGRART